VKKNNWVPVLIPLLIALAVFACALAVLHWAFAAAALAALGFYGGLSFFLSPAFFQTGVNVHKNVQTMKNRDEIMALLEEGDQDLASIKKIIDKSKDPRIKTKALAVYREGGKITGYVKKNPAKALLARRFFSYYLDRANEMLKRYDDLVSFEVETERLAALKEKTLSVLDTIQRGMVLQFSKLISSEVIDIEAEIRLLESTFRMEDL
jgi:5-bromo-4-chloroindolyl phosphate hydrolysis protein